MGESARGEKQRCSFFVLARHPGANARAHTEAKCGNIEKILKAVESAAVVIDEMSLSHPGVTP